MDLSLRLMLLSKLISSFSFLLLYSKWTREGHDECQDLPLGERKREIN